VRHDLEGILPAYVEAAAIAGEAKDAPLFRASNGRKRALAAKPLGTERICESVKRQLKDVGLPSQLSPHSFQVTTITALLEQRVPIADVQYLAGHAEPRTTGLYDQRKKKATRNFGGADSDLADATFVTDDSTASSSCEEVFSDVPDV
jgi:integrase/recombinase XerD